MSPIKITWKAEYPDGKVLGNEILTNKIDDLTVEVFIDNIMSTLTEEE